MKCVLVYLDDVGRRSTNVVRHERKIKIFEGDSEREVCEKVRRFKDPFLAFELLFVVDHEIELPKFP